MNPLRFPDCGILLLLSLCSLSSPLAAQDSALGRGVPEFVRSPQTFEPTGANDLFLEDLDGDGDIDAVISSFGTSFVLRNDGAGRFSESWRRQTTHGLAVGDIDQDGDPDLVTAPDPRWGGVCEIHLNDGRGEFEQRESDLCRGDGPHFLTIRLADLDSDLDLDVIDYRADGISVAWLNDGQGEFERSSIQVPRHAGFSDLNGDGYQDVLSREAALEINCDPPEGCGQGGWAPREGEPGYRVYLNDRGGGFENHSFLHLPGLRVSDYRPSWFMDIDNDGDQDVVYTDHVGFPGPVGVLRNDGTGRLTENGPGLATVDNGKIGAGDLNGDGYVDLVIADNGNPAQIWMNDGTGTFHDSGVRLGERFASQSLGVADLDGDGDNDVFITDYRRPGTSVWLNQLADGSR